MKYLLLSISFLYCILGYSQQKIIDSLEIELQKHSTPNKNQLQILNDLSYYYALIDPNKGLEFSNKAIAIAEKANLKSSLAKAYKNKGVNYSNMSKDSLALVMYDKAIELQKQTGDFSGVAKTNFNKGLIYFDRSDFLRANECNLQAYEIFEKEKDSFLMAKMLNSIGINQMYRSLYPEAINTYLKALKIYEDIDLTESFEYASIYANIGILHKRIGNYDLAIEYQNVALEVYEDLDYPIGIANVYNSLGNIYDSMNQPNEAITYYDKSYGIMENIGNNEGMASALANIGIAYTNNKKYSKGIEYLNKAKQIYKDLENINNLAIVHSSLGDNYLEQYKEHSTKNGLIRTAEANFSTANTYAKDIENLDLQIETLDKLAQVNYIMNNFKKAYNLKAQVETLKDSFSLSEKKAEIAKLEAEFDYQRKETKLKNDYEVEKAVSEAKLARQRLLKNISAIGGSCFVLFAIVGFILYKRKREAVTKALISNTELKALRSQMNPHFIFNSLNSISDYVMKNNTESAINYLSKFAKLMRQILENSEKKLIPLEDDIAILTNYLDIEQNRFSNKFSYNIAINETIDIQNTLIPPLILQPFIENSIIHGFKGTKANGLITITIEKEDDMLVCTVDDNGIGRNTNTLANQNEHKSLGMKITKNRINIINMQKNAKGSVKIIDKEQGTQVKVSIPLQLVF